MIDNLFAVSNPLLLKMKPPHPRENLHKGRDLNPSANELIIERNLVLQGLAGRTLMINRLLTPSNSLATHIVRGTVGAVNTSELNVLSLHLTVPIFNRWLRSLQFQPMP